MRKMTSIITTRYRRRKENKTNYKKRIHLLLSDNPRLVIRRSLKNMVVQLVKHAPEGDKVLVSAHSRELIQYGWPFNKGNLPSAYLTGLLFGKKASGKYKEAIADLGLQNPRDGTRLYAVIKGVVDAGVLVPCDPEAFPTDDRLKGEHIIKNHFNKNRDAKELSTLFELCKEKIMKG